MFGAIYVGLSGLTAYSRGLQQVSGNVTNLNSLGYKSEDVSFTNLVTGNNGGGQTFSRQGDSAVTGVASEARRDFSQGELRQSERDLDLAVSGSGYLVLQRGSEIVYTRTGSFEVGEDGFIVLAGTDYRLATIDESGALTTLSIDPIRTDPADPTSRVTLADNLSSQATSHTLSDVRVIDDTGKEHVWKIEFTPIAATPGKWSVQVKEGTTNVGAAQEIQFMASGTAIDPSDREVVIEAAPGFSVTLDLTAVSSQASGQVSTLRAASVDGHKVGGLTTVQVNSDGQVELVYSNEEKRQLGAVALADFRDPQVLEQGGGGLLRETRDGGRELMKSGDPAAGRVLSRRLEASNVDLAKQFGELILIQRGFQASSQIISVSNDMIQQLFGIRGQG